MQGRVNVKRGFPSFWGDGSDGILTAGATYPVEIYSGFCIKQFSSIDWNPGAPETLTVDNPCRGLILLVDGNVNIGADATISMAKKGSILPCNPGELIDRYHESMQIRKIVDKLKTLQGGNGGNGGMYGNGGGIVGTGGTGRNCQGGRGGGGAAYGAAGGSVIYSEAMGYGGHVGDTAHTAYSGWNGGGGGAVEDEKSGGGGHPYGAGGGGGGNGGAFVSGGYCGNNGEHTGGFILIIAHGNVTIAGTLDVRGGNGGTGGYGTFGGGGGGGAGGGVIAIFSMNAIDTTGATKTLTGGAGGAGGGGYETGRPGTSGQNGTYYEEQLSV